MTERELYLPDGTTPRCQAVGVTGQCKLPDVKHGHNTPHDPPDAIYLGTFHPASFYNED